ncbi:MAG: serine/threonine protein kinase [Blastocatellia bacterium]|nr:serine/threonine protein kinase [Blastocatellia bacterium]MBL8192559.1 serine/threonine protein kinase [Blastocatellia bacterium]MBN8724703.1 serine/threonine protein kinase [Acidobacteriota bacterium]
MATLENKSVIDEQFFDSLIGKELNNTYKLEKKIGVGGMGSVFRATDIHSGEEVAIKIISPNLSRDSVFVKRFQREAQICWMLSHPNIVKVHEFGETPEKFLFMVMEFVDGEPLDDYLEGKLPLKPKHCLKIAKPLAGALELAHIHSILHRDLKPSNVLVKEKGDEIIVKLVDFGIVKMLESDGLTDSSSLTLVGEVFGTPHYMSPEQLMEDPIGPMSDIYALGTMVYEMLAGNLPINSTNVNDILTSKIKNTPIELSRKYSFIPEAFDPVIKKAIAYNPKERYQSADEFIRAFEEVVNKYPDGQIEPVVKKTNSEFVAFPELTTEMFAPETEKKEVVESNAEVTNRNLTNATIDKVDNKVDKVQPLIQQTPQVLEVKPNVIVQGKNTNLEKILIKATIVLLLAIITLIIIYFRSI